MQYVDPSATAEALGGIASRTQLIEGGASGTDITSAIRRGTLRRVRRAHYASARASAAAVEAVRIGGRLDAASAASSYGLWTDARALQVVVAPNASRLRAPRDPRTRIRWAAAGPSRECWRIGLPASLAAVARDEPREAAIACLDTARTVFGVTTGQLLDWVGKDARARVCVLASRPGSESGWESIVRQRLMRRGLRVRQQIGLPGARRGDLFVEERLLVEVDGFEFHGDREAFERDHERDAVMAASGYAHIRLSVRQVRDRWSRTEALLLAALRSARPFSGVRVAGGARGGSRGDFRTAGHTVS